MEKIRHIAIIMDGNGRWAKAQGKIRTEGHFKGVEVVRDIAIAANERGIEALTLYAFSTENWKRSSDEVGYLMKLPAFFFSRYLKELMEKNIRITMMGDMDELPVDTQNILKKAIEQTKNNTAMTLNFAMNYGSRREIVKAAEAYTQDVLDGKVENHCSEELFEHYLMTDGLPPIDLCIRTSKEYRLSNFLLWQLAYAELIFIDTLWPDFNEETLDYCLNEFKKRDRRFGGVKG